LKECFIDNNTEFTEDEKKYGRVIFSRKANRQSPFEYKW